MPNGTDYSKPENVAMALKQLKRLQRKYGRSQGVDVFVGLYGDNAARALCGMPLVQS